jgi:hypothetical protein
MVKGTDDFRFAAAEESVRLLKQARLSNPFNSESSLCVPLDGDATGKLYRVAVVPWLFLLPGLLLVLFGIVYTVLIFTPWVDGTGRAFLLAGGTFISGVVILVTSHRVATTRFDHIVAGRNGAARIADLEGRATECHQFAIEDPATYQKQKIISEDYAKGGLDRTGRGLLLAGIQYQYVIRPRDVTEVTEDESHILITLRVGAASLTLAISPLILNDKQEKAFRQELMANLKPAVNA